MRTDRYKGLIFALPALLAICMLVVYPVVYLVRLGVTDARGAYVGLANFETMASSRVTAVAAFNTIYYVGGSIVGQVILGTAVGILLNLRFRGLAIVRALTLIPWVMPSIVAATMWFWMLHTEFGIVNHLLVGAGAIDQPVGWLTNRATVMPAMIAVNVWKLFPFVAIMVLAGLQAVPEELYDAARIDGASFLDEVRHVMLPQLRPVLSAVVLLLTIWGLNAITLVYAVTRGGPGNQTLITPIQILRQGFEAFELNEAAALAAMYLVVSLIVVAVYVGWFAPLDGEANS
jgi:multiple sugar transport system permease protein